MEDDGFLDDLLADVGSDLQSTVEELKLTSMDSEPALRKEIVEKNPQDSIPQEDTAISSLLPPGLAKPIQTRLSVCQVNVPRMSATAFARTDAASLSGLFHLCESWRRVNKRGRTSFLSPNEELLSLSVSESLSIATPPSSSPRPSKLRRFAIAGTGRISFGTSEDDIPPAFRQGLTDQALILGAIEKNERQPSHGIEAAYQRMAAWQEEWPEDEDLPDCTSFALQDTHAATKQPLSREKQKDTMLAQARIQKVLTSKRKSRMYG